MKQFIKLDRENGNILWWDAVCQEMNSVCPVFEPWEKPEEDIPPGYQDIKCHFIFDINMGDNFLQNTCFVASGHMTETPATLTYNYIVSRDLVRILLTIAARNGLDILSYDIQNAYLTADCLEKIWTCAGPEFGSEAGTIMIVRNSLYGLKYRGAAFYAHLGETLHAIGFLSTEAYPDLWCQPMVKPNIFEY